MRNVKEISRSSESTRERAPLWHVAEVDRLVSDLETNGIVVLPNILTPDQLRGMQQVCKRILAPAQILSRPARCREKCCIAEVLNVTGAFGLLGRSSGVTSDVITRARPASSFLTACCSSDCSGDCAHGRGPTSPMPGEKHSQRGCGHQGCRGPAKKVREWSVDAVAHHLFVI